VSVAAQPDIVCLGEPLAEFTRLPDAHAERYLAGHGGDTSNCAIAAARQGARVAYVTSVGADPFGESFLELWRTEGVDATHVKRRADAQTGVYFITHGEGGHAFTYYRAGSAASRMGPADVPEAVIAGAKVLHVSGISQAISDSACAAVDRAIDIARANGVRLSYDPNLRLKLWPLDRARTVINATAARAAYVLTNVEEGGALTGRAGAEGIANAYLDLGAGVVAVKRGAGGALIATAGARSRIPGHAVEAVDASGAGDVFDGAFLAEIVAGRDAMAAARYANAAAALSTTGFGAVAPIPRRADVAAFLTEAATERRSAPI
jgi:2-dehydro-3-deoxygluconokinase